MKTKTLSICPEYSLMVIRDVTLFDDQEEAAVTVGQAGTSIAAASRKAVYVCAAQSLLRVQLTVDVYSRPRVAGDAGPWDGALRFDVAFPSGTVQFGDSFHRADTLDLPGGGGTCTVTVRHAGRTAAFDAVRRLNEKILEWSGDDEERELDRHANIERYLVTLEPRM